MASPFDLRISQDWSKPSSERVKAAKGDHRVWQEAGRATLEAVVRYLVRRGWQRFHTSKAKWDQRSDSRYLQAPKRPSYEIRVSNHAMVNRYRGAHEYIITRDVMVLHTVLGLVNWIEADLRKSNEKRARKFQRQRDESARWYDDKAA